ncbi:MAG: dicarboxylate/amino acid:cation symporter [Alphaproteobacteria bacterium]
MSTTFQKWLPLMKSPYGIFGGVILGVLIGVYFPIAGDYLGPAGDIFIKLMKMCIIPIIVGSVSLSIANLIATSVQKNFLKIALVMIGISVIASVIGLMVSVSFNPGGDIDPSLSPSLKVIVEEVTTSEVSMDEPIESERAKGLFAFLLRAVPKNIFESLSESRTFQIIVFSLIFGVALGFSLRGGGSTVFRGLEEILDIFTNIFNTILYALPLVVLCLMARDSAHLGTDTLIGMAGFVMKFYIAFAILFVLGQLAIMWRTKTSLIESLNALKYPIFISFATTNSIAAIPAAINSMREGFGLGKQLTGMLVPLGIIVGRYGNCMYYAFCAVFVAQLYSVNLGFNEYMFIISVSIFAGMASAGTTGTLTLPLLTLVLDPLGLPLSAVLALLIAVDPIIDPARTLMNVHTTCSGVSLIVPKSNNAVLLPENSLGK